LGSWRSEAGLTSTRIKEDYSVSCAGVGVWLLPLAATPDRAHDDLDRQPEDDQVGDHLPCDDEPRSLALIRKSTVRGQAVAPGAAQRSRVQAG
jgi:hypothetical protein